MLYFICFLDQSMEAPLSQTSIADCVWGMSQKLKDQLLMKFQLAQITTIHDKLFKLY